MASIIKADTLQSTTANVFVLNSSGTEYARFNSSGVFQLANPTTFPAGTAADPSITATGDTNTGLYFPTADTIGFVEGGTEVMRINSSGDVGIGTTNPQAKLHVNTTSAAAYIGYGANFDNYFQTNNNTYFTNYNGATEYGRFDSSGNFRFNSGYGSSATAYGCRAWVNFNGIGTIAIRGSGNVSSITDNGVGDYTINFTTAMPDANYSLVGTVQFDTSGNEASHNLMGLEIKGIATPLTTTSARVAGKYGGATATYDMNTVAVAIFR